MQVGITTLNTNNTAILIFANSAQQEAFAKPFESSALLFDALNRDILKKVERTGLPYYHVSEKEQIGNSFAQRFTNAIQSIYANGYDRVIAVGNDTPHLNSAKILKAAQQLETNDIVLGPSLDGGFYLMGLKKSHFNAKTFLKLPWQTAGLSQSMFRLIAANKTKLFTLETLVDIDSISDVNRILQSKRHISTLLRQLLLAVFSEKNTSFFRYQLSLQNTFLSLYYNKGSPIFLQK